VVAYWSDVTFMFAIYIPSFNYSKWNYIIYNIGPVTKFKKKKSYRGIFKFLNTHSEIDNKLYLFIYLHDTNDRCGSGTSIFWFRESCLQRSVRTMDVR